MGEPPVPPAAGSFPVARALVWGVAAYLFAFVGAFAAIGAVGIALLDLDALNGSWAEILANTAALLAGAQGWLYLGLAAGRPPNLLVVVATAIAAFAALYAGHAVAFGAGGPRLDRATAVTYGGSVAVPWLVLTVAGLLALSGTALAVGAAALPFPAAFGALFGGLGGVLANR